MASEATVVERQNFVLFTLSPVKIRGWVGKMSSSRFQVQPRTRPVMYFCCRVAAHAGRLISTVSRQFFTEEIFERILRFEGSYIYQMLREVRTIISDFKYRFLILVRSLYFETGAPQRPKLGQVMYFDSTPTPFEIGEGVSELSE